MVHTLDTRSLTNSNRASCVSTALMLPAHILWINWCVCAWYYLERKTGQKREIHWNVYLNPTPKTLPELQTKLVHLIHPYRLHRSRYVCVSYPNCNFCCRYFPLLPNKLLHASHLIDEGGTSLVLVSVSEIECALITWESLTLCKSVCSWVLRLSLDLLPHTVWRC